MFLLFLLHLRVPRRHRCHRLADGLDVGLEEFDARAYGGEGGGGNSAKVAPAPHVRLGEASKLVSQTPVQPYDGEGE